jgi:hypothetical protein
MPRWRQPLVPIQSSVPPDVSAPTVRRVRAADELIGRDDDPAAEAERRCPPRRGRRNAGLVAIGDSRRDGQEEGRPVARRPDTSRVTTARKPPATRRVRGGQGRDRTGDLPLFRRTLVPTELPGREGTGHLADRDARQTMATLTGLEPATSAVTGRRANQLRHRALLCGSIVRAPRVPPTGFEPALPP